MRVSHRIGKVREFVFNCNKGTNATNTVYDDVVQTLIDTSEWWWRLFNLLRIFLESVRPRLRFFFLLEVEISLRALSFHS